MKRNCREKNVSRKKNDNVHGNLVLGTPKSSLKSRGEVFSNASPRAPGFVPSRPGGPGSGSWGSPASPSVFISFSRDGTVND